ncbi:MAG: S-layer homology domain-containing protein [Deltaproteobacteria bacterium]|nr:S-layer homology domain-containing protein [Deltaproteobacteria bacterium]
MGRIEFRTGIRWMAAIAVVVLTISCGPKVQQPLSQLDTPEHHTFTGNRLLQQEKWADAAREFELALRLDPRYAKAHAGVALAKAYQQDFAGAFAALKQAEKNVRDKDEELLTLVGVIRVNTLSRAACLNRGAECKPDDEWLKNSRAAFDQALVIEPKSAAAYYFMGECVLTALDLETAGRMFRQVISLNGDYVADADKRWKLVQKIQRAMPGTVTGKKIALVTRLTRADAAALFMEELKIDVLYQRRTPKSFDTAFKDPEQAKKAIAGTAVPADIAAHPLRADIEALLKIGARGLEVYPDGSFRPDEPVDRAGYAMMIEDILIKVSGNQALATQFIGSASPFPDLRADLPYFNAAMVVTSRGIMEAKNMMTGEFAPQEPVAGADALLVIRKIRDELRY